jgi:(S)-2-hydroxyglutarate dehydrogenase
MQRFDCVVIGGGILGLSVAWWILEKNPDVRIAVLEKEAEWARHQTGRNSGVIHSGIYYRPGSLKAKLCREGNRRLLEFCQRYDIRYEVCGKVIVATTETELPLLKKLYERASANGLTVRELTAEEVKEIEPNVSCLGGIHVPSTGIVNFGDVCLKLAELIANRGGELRLGAEVRALHTDNSEEVVETSEDTLRARWIINCAGLHSDRIAILAGAKPNVRIVPFRGEYYELIPERRGLVRNLIYPVPDPKLPFLGVHFTRMIDGRVHAGPNAVLSLKREGYHRTSFDWRDFMDTVTYAGFWRMAAKHAGTGLEEMRRSLSKKAFLQSLQRLIPEIRERDLVAGGAGVRAQAVRPDGDLVDDFLIMKTSSAIHVCNAPSPAATASLEIARVIVEQASELFGHRFVQSP